MYLQLTPVMRKVLTMSTEGKDERGGGRTRWMQNDFVDTDVGNNYDRFNVYIKTFINVYIL